MDGLLVFDVANDLIFKFINDPMKEKLEKLVDDMKLVREDEDDKYMNSNVIMQIFSPLITSQRIMMCQFDNAYNYIECDDLKVVFEQFLGYTFLKFNDNSKSVDWMERSLRICISFMRHLCGASIYLLKTDNKKSEMLTSLLTTWQNLYDKSQDVMLESIEQLVINTEVKNVVMNALNIAVEKLKQDPHSQKNHALIFIDNKFLSIFSSKQSQPISTSDLLFLNILCHTLNFDKKLETFLIFLQGQLSKTNSGCSPYIVHIIKLNKEFKLVLLVEYGNSVISNSLYEIFFQLNKIKNLQMQTDMESLKPAYENLDVTMRQLTDIVKKVKYNNHELDECIKNFLNKYDTLKKKYVDMIKILDKDQLMKVESYLPYFEDASKEFFKLACLECSTLENGTQRVLEISTLVDEKLIQYADFLEVKAKKNFTMASYLEEFAGLIHFIYIDRQNGRMISPNIDLTAEQTSQVIKTKVWDMVEAAREHFKNGQTSFIWKDCAFSYSYFLWFEDMNGQPIKPKDQTKTLSPVKTSCPPGILSDDYYQFLIEIFFPKSSTGPNKIKCYELYCLHLGLVTSSCVLEHTRRLAATITDITDLSTNPFELL